MQIKKQVCSLELAKRLQKLGVNRDSIFLWDERNGGCKLVFDITGLTPYTHQIRAFTVAELGEILSTCRFWSEHFELTLGVYHTGTFRNFYCKTEQDSHSDKHLEAETEADARAKMLIYLLENKLISNE